MRLILLFACGAALLAQQSIPSPVTVGGVNCAEIRMKEAIATGSSFATLKSCRGSDGYSGLSISSSDTGKTTFRAGGLSNIFYGSQQFNALDSTDARAILQHLAGNAEFQILGSGGYVAGRLSAFGTGHGSLQLKDINGQGDALLETGATDGARLGLQAKDTTVERAILEAGAFAAGGRLQIKNASNILTVDAHFANGLRTFDASTGTLRWQAKTSGAMEVFQLTSPGTPSAGYSLLYVNGSNVICSRDASNNDNCIPSASSFVTISGTQTVTGQKTFNGGFIASSGGNNLIDTTGGLGALYNGSQVWRALGGTDPKMGFTVSSGNGRLYLANQSNVNAVDITSQGGSGHGQIIVKDINGDGDAVLETGTSNGARLALNASDTTRNGFIGEGGSFTGGGRLSLYTSSNVLGARLDNLSGLELYDGSGITMRSRGIAWEMRLGTPSVNPSAGNGHLYLNGSGDICRRNASGTDACVFPGVGYVTTDGTDQTISGLKRFSAGLRWNTYGELTSGTGSAPYMVMRSPSGVGDSTFEVYGGSSSQNGYLQMQAHDTSAIGWRVEVARSGGTFQDLYNPSGTVAISMSTGSGFGQISTRTSSGAIGVALESSYIDIQTSSAPGNPSFPNQRVYMKSGGGLCWKDSVGTETCPGAAASGSFVDLSSAQTITGAKTFTQSVTVSAANGFTANDSVGSASIFPRNRFGENGLLIQIGGTNELADVMLRGPFGSQMTVRMEARAGLTFLDSSLKELQFGDLFNYNSGNSIGLMVNVNGFGGYRGDYMQLMGASTGRVRLYAASGGTSYDLYLPTTAATTNGDCFKWGTGGQTFWGSCGGSTSTMPLPLTLQSGSTNRFEFFATGTGGLNVRNSAGTITHFLDAAGYHTFYSGGSVAAEIGPSYVFARVPGGSGQAWMGINGSSAGEIFLTNSVGTVQARINQLGFQFQGNTGLSVAFTIPGTGCSLFFSGGVFTGKSGC